LEYWKGWRSITMVKHIKRLICIDSLTN